MAASAWRVYNEAKKYMLTADLDINAAAMRIKLVKGTAAGNVSAYTRSTFASITGAPSNIPTAVSGYALGGIAVTALNGSATQNLRLTTAI